MTGKTVLITGGIGRAAAIGLASMSARVGITGRDRAERAAAIAKAFGAHITDVCSTTKMDLVRSISADHRRTWGSADRFDNCGNA